MKRLPALTDDALRRALAPDPGRAAPVGLLTSIAEEIARTPQRSGTLVWRPWIVGAARGRGTWVLVAAAATLVLLAGLLLTSAGRPVPVSRPALVLPPLVTDGDFDAQFLAVGREEAWVSDGDGALWHGSAAGWTGPESSPVMDVRALALLHDGRLVVAGEGGLRVRQLDGRWSVVGDSDSNDMAISSDGTIWVAEGRALVGYRETEGGWNRTRVDCPAGGFLLVVATDGAVWTGGFAYTGNLGLARLAGTRCDKERFEDGTHEVYDLAAGPNGQIAARVSDLAENGYRRNWTDQGQRTVLWNGSAWTTLAPEPASDPWRRGLGIGPDGTVFAAADQGINRYRDGRWETVVDHVVFMGTMLGLPPKQLATAPDGTLWYASWRPGHLLAVEQVPNTDPGN